MIPKQFYHNNLRRTHARRSRKNRTRTSRREVDQRAADVDNSVMEEQVVAAEEEQPKDELDTISESVQKRIDKLTYKMREAERQRDEAVSYAQNISNSNNELKEKLKNSDSSLFKEYDNRIQSDIERAKTYLKTAQETGDAEAITDATEKLSRASAEAENLRRLSAQQQLKEKDEVEVPVEEYKPSIDATQTTPDPKAEEWASRNTWFGTDSAMTFAAFGVHKEIVEEGIDPTILIFIIKKLINVCEIISKQVFRRAICPRATGCCQ